MTGEIAVLAWIVTVMICLGLAAVVWRRTRPLAHPLIPGSGKPGRWSRWFVWAPSGVLLVTGGVVAFHLFVTRNVTLETLSLEPVLIWLGICIFMQIQTLFAMRGGSSSGRKGRD